MKKNRTKLHYLPALIVLLVSLIVLALLWQELSRREARDIHESFVSDTKRISVMVNERMAAYSQVLRSGAGFFSGSEHVTRDDWHHFVEKLDIDQNYKGIQGVGFTMVVPAQKLDEHIRAIRSQGFPDYIIKPAGDRETYTSIIYLEPFSGRNLRAFGYDMFSEKTRNEAMARSRDIGDVAFTGKVQLVQETKKDVQSGLLAYFPVYRNGVIAQTVEQRRAALIGWVYSPYRMEDLLDAIASNSLAMIRMEVFDGENVIMDSLLYDSHAEHPELAAAESLGIVTTQKIELGGRYWTIRYTALPGYEATLKRQPIWIELLGLAIIGLLLFGMTWLLINTRRNAEAIADELTASIRKSEARYNALFSESKVPMLLIDPESGRILETNHIAEAFYGYGKTQLESMNISDINCLSRREIAAEMALADQEKRSHFYFKHRMADGSIRDVEAHTGPIEVDGQRLLYSIIHDITERKMLEAQLAESEERFNFAVEASGDGLWDWNIATGEAYFSRRWKEMLGFADHELPNRLEEWKDRIHPDDLPRVMEDVQAYFAGKTSNYVNEHRVLCKDGTYKWILARGMVAKRDADGRPSRMIGTHTDMTESREAADVLKQAKESAESLAASKAEFLANMSHEIRTPMNAIIGLSHLALNKKVSADVRDYLEKINSSSESLLNILNEILDFSKMEAGKLQIENRRFQLDNILDSLHNLFSQQAQEKSINLDIEVAEDVPTDLIGDSLRLQQILSNLLGNAIKFTDRGRVAIKIKLLEAEESQARIHFCVCDTGIGVSQEDQAKLFHAFSQVDTSATRRFGGTGLGLAISRNLLSLMGSDLHLESTPGQGSNFSFDLLLSVGSSKLYREVRRRHQGRKAGALSQALKERGQVLSGTRILVAEDNRINQQVVEEFLTLSGVHVDLASNGREALALLEQHAYDAVLMDVHMPEMDGIEATENIRRQPRFKGLPVIALTAGVTREERESSLASGMNDFIAKPINPEALIETLVKWVRPVAGEVPADEDWSSIEQALPDFNLANLKTLIGGDSHLLISMLRTFLDDCTKESGMILNHLQSAQVAEAEKLLHKLKGAAGSLGAVALYQRSAELDDQLQQGHYTEETLAKWKTSLDATMQAIAGLMSRCERGLV